MNELSVKTKVIELINKMSEDQQKNLLDLIKCRQAAEHRGHPRTGASVEKLLDSVTEDK